MFEKIFYKLISRVLNDTVDVECNIIDVYNPSYVTHLRTTLQSQKETYSDFSLQWTFLVYTNVTLSVWLSVSIVVNRISCNNSLFVIHTCTTGHFIEDNTSRFISIR